MADILQKIVATKRGEIAAASASVPLAQMKRRALEAGGPRDFAGAIRARVDIGTWAVIAEIKKASPSKGVLRKDFDPDAIARSYATAGATCLSVLTDRQYFHGDPEHLRIARSACGLPVLRKDFIVDAYQVYEARAMGADCILLIVAALGVSELRELESHARGAGMAVLVEIHDEAELDAALSLDTPLLGINNRNLRSFETRLDTTFNLLGRIPEGRLVVTESGIRTREDVQTMMDRGVQAFLIGEAFMREPDPGDALAKLFKGIF